MTIADLSVETNDFDTLGSRLSRARDAKNASLPEVAEWAGVEVQTLEEWESDQAEPRSNRLMMLAGILGVTPSWLLFGRGTSPAEESSAATVEAIELQLDRLKLQRQKISTAIEDASEALRQAELEASD